MPLGQSQRWRCGHVACEFASELVLDITDDFVAAREKDGTGPRATVPIKDMDKPTVLLPNSNGVGPFAVAESGQMSEVRSSLRSWL
jgi:hypothetical protein